MTQPPVLIHETMLERFLASTRYRLEQDIARCNDPQSRTFCPWYAPDKLPKLQRDLTQVIDVQMYLDSKAESPHSTGEET